MRNISRNFFTNVSGARKSVKGVSCHVLSCQVWSYLLSHSHRTCRQDWSCEACFAMYPLYQAIMLYLIDMLLLDPNVLRDSILVCLHLSICLLSFLLFYNPMFCARLTPTTAAGPDGDDSLRMLCACKRDYVAGRLQGVESVDE